MAELAEEDMADELAPADDVEDADDVEEASGFLSVTNDAGRA